ncbi:MAG: hypothetical protein K2H85_05005, partial [Allobaculum sp.]|nr:hypothetical protein [Allobaculum sp.]
KYSYESGSSVLVPLVLLPIVFVEQWNNIFHVFCSQLFEKKLITEKEMAKLEAFVSNIDENYETRIKQIEFSYRLMTYCLSDLVFHIFSEKMDICTENLSKFLITSTFGKEVADIFKTINTLLSKHKNKFDDLFEILQAVDELCTSPTISNESYELFCSLTPRGNAGERTLTEGQIDGLLKDYIDKIHQKNERRADRKKPRLEGIYWSSMIDFLSSHFDLNWNQESYLIARLCNKWDCGIALYIVELHKADIESEDLVGGCIIDGEQTYHEVIHDKSTDEVICFYEVFRRTGEKMDVALKEYCRIIEFVKRHGVLNADKMTSVYEYFSRKHSVDTLKTCLYPEVATSPKVRLCLSNYKKDE